MTNLILENLPDDLIKEIEKLAQQHHQSVNEQIISILKQSPTPSEIFNFSRN